MLLVSRQTGESLLIAEIVELTVSEISNGFVTLSASIPGVSRQFHWKLMEGESMKIVGSDITITVVGIQANRSHLLIEAPVGIEIIRREAARTAHESRS